MITSYLFTSHYVSQLSLPLENISVINGNYITKNDLNLPKIGENLVTISLKPIYEQIINNKWAKTVSVKKVFPDQINIKIGEHKPFAIWDKKFLIDKEGYIITDKLSKTKLLSVIGGDAHLYAYNFIQMIDTLDLEMVKELEYVNKRRWNVVFRKGLTLKLPEENTKEVWKQALGIIERNNLLENRVLDMRIPDKFFVR